jgi:hypothetical protein
MSTAKDTVHTGEAQDNTVRGWKRAARESSAGTPGNEGDAMLGTDADDGLNFIPGSRQHNGGPVESEERLGHRIRRSGADFAPR